MLRLARPVVACRAARFARHCSSGGLSPDAMAKALAADPQKLEQFVKALPVEAKKTVGLR